MSNVVDLNCKTRLDLPAEKVLGKALEADLDIAVVIGYDKDGEFYFASTTSNGADVVWLFEQGKLELLEAHRND